MRSFYKISLLCYLMVLMLPITIQGQTTAGNKNVLFISIDDLRPELNCYGNRDMHTPNIDRLASDGMRFSNASTQQAICTPSRISMLLGLRPATTGLYGLDDKMKTNHSHFISFPHALKNAGYKTYSFGKIYHHKDDDLEAWTETPWRNVGSNYTLSYGEGMHPPTESNNVPDNSYPDGKIADQVISKLEEIQNDQFFLAVGFMKPHLPFTCPQQYWDIYDRAEIPMPSTSQPNDIWSGSLQEWQELRGQYSGIPIIEEGDLDADLSRELKHGYWACVSYVDAQVGRVLDKLDDLGLRENTIVVLWSDHGWKLGEYGDWCKHTCMEVDVRIPLMIDVPGMDSDVCDRAVESVDIYPTLMELLEIENFPNYLDGVSMKPLLENPDAEWKKAAFAQYPRYGGVMGTSVRTQDYRYTEYREESEVLKEVGELYDHTTYEEENPLGVEYNNVVLNSSYSSVLSEMKKLINAGWDGVRYGASLSIKSQTVNSVTFTIKRLPGAGTLKLFQRIDDEEATEIKIGEIISTTDEVTVTDLLEGKAYYFKLQIEWGEGNYNYSPEIAISTGKKTMLVDNGDFSSELSTGWTARQNNGSAMTYNISEGALSASVSALTSSFWDIGFLNNKASSFSNQDVTISFRAKANTAAEIKFALDFDTKQYPIKSITTAWQQYSLTYNNVSSSAFQLRMWLTTIADYEIDDIEVFYGTGATIELTPEGGTGSTIGGNVTSVKNLVSQSKYNAYLIKSHSGYNVMASEQVSQWQLFDMNGRQILSRNNIHSTSLSVNLTSVNNGTYVLVLDSNVSLKLIWLNNK
jgi:iduronate 2-sulfatase